MVDCTVQQLIYQSLDFVYSLVEVFVHIFELGLIVVSRLVEVVRIAVEVVNQGTFF